MQQTPEHLPVCLVQLRLHRRPFNPPRRLEVVPHDHEGFLLENTGQRVELFVRLGRGKVGAEDRLAQPVEDVFGVADVVEGEPEAALAHPAGVAEPLHEAARQRRLADAAEPVDQDARRRAAHGPLQLQHLPVPPDEAVRILGVERFLRQRRFLSTVRFYSLSGEGKVESFLFVDDGDEPVLERKGASGTDAIRLREHLLPPGPRRRRQALCLEQAAVEGGQEVLRPAPVERIGHRHDTAHPRPEHRRRHRGEGIVRVLVHHARLAGIQHHSGNPMLAQQRAERLGRHVVFLSFLVFEEQVPLRPFEGMRPSCGSGAVAAVPVEVQDVVEIRVVAQVLPQAVERRGSQHAHRRRQVSVFDQLDQAAGDGAVRHVLAHGPGRHQQDVDPVFGQFLGKRQRVGHLVEPPPDLALRGNPASLGVVERLPGPGQHARVVARDVEVQVCEAVLRSLGVPLDAFAAVEECFKGLLSPCLQGGLHPLGAVGVWREGVVEKVFEIPAQLPHQVAVGASFDGEAVRRGHRRRVGRLAVASTNNQELGRITVGDVADNEILHSITLNGAYLMLFDK